MWQLEYIKMDHIIINGISMLDLLSSLTQNAK